MIADFGICKNLEEQTSNSSVRGIHAYIEPQCKDPSYKRNEKSDIYSLGILFWEISSGRTPFLNFNSTFIPHNICGGLRETPVVNTPLKYQQLYQKCWDADPESRPDINEVHEALADEREILVQNSGIEGDNQYVQSN